MANLKDIGYGVGKYLTASDASDIPDIGTNRKNLDLLNFKVATNNAYALYNFKDGMIDAYQTEDGVDTATSANEDYNSTDKVYTPNFGNYFGNGELGNCTFGASSITQTSDTVAIDTVLSTGSESGGPGNSSYGPPSTESALYNTAGGVQNPTACYEFTVPNKNGSYDGDMFVAQFKDLTIDANVTLTVDQPCRGLFVYVDGDCTMNGFLSMTARGGNSNPTTSGGSDSSVVDAAGLQLPMLTSGGTSTLAAPTFAGAGSSVIAAVANQPAAAGNGTIFTISKLGGAGAASTTSHHNQTYAANSTTGGSTIATMGAPSGYSFYYEGGGSGNGGGDGGAFSSGAGGGGCTNNVSAVDAKGGNYGGVGGKANRSGGGSGQGGWGGEGNPAGGVTGNTPGYGGPGFNGCAGIVWLVVNGDITFGVDGQVDCSGTDGHSGVTWVAHDGPSGGGAAFVLYSGSAPAPNINVSGGRGPEVANWRYGGKYDAQVSPKNTTGGMTLISNAQTAAQADPEEGRLMLYEEDVDAITLDTDLKGYVSRDGGTTYTQTPLVEDTVYESSVFNQGGIDANTALMLHFDGTNGGTTFTDNAPSPHTVEVSGNTNTSTAQKKFGTASGYFDGTGDFLRIATSGDGSYVMGTGNFTVDFWAYDVKVADSDSTVVQIGRGSYGACIGYVHSGGNFVLYLASSNGGWQIASAVSMGSLPGAAWAHYALVRNGNTWTTYKDGTQVSQFSDSASLYVGDEDMQIGRYTYSDNSTTNEMEGYIDELRVSKGVARWTADFTPPTSAYSTGAAAEAYTKRLVSGAVDISGQPSGTNMKYKIETLNNKNLKLHGASLLWA